MNNTPFSKTSERLVEYINQVYKPCLVLGDWQVSKDLPLYLQGGWAYQLLELDGHECLLMLDEHESQDTAQRLKKIIKKVNSYFNGPIIYGVGEITSYNRKRLIDQGIAFVVPGKQLYLPFMALDLRESFVSAAQPAVIRLGACAQQLLLMRLYGLWQPDVSAQAVAEQLAISKMTVSRAYRELSELGLADVELVGRSSRLVFEADNYALWKLAQPYVTSPVKKQVWLSREQFNQHRDLFQHSAGEQALAQQGMLAAPKQACYAVSAADWPSLKNLLGLEEQVGFDEESVLIQLWRYSPSWLDGFTDSSGVVDRISLYLSMRSHEDERIDIALDEMMQLFWKEQGQ